MGSSHTPLGGANRPPRTRAALLVIAAMCFAAMVLGPLAAIAAAGGPSSPADSGGGGLITTSTDGENLTVGTTTLVATTPPTTTVANGTTTTQTSTTCTEPSVGTVTAATTATATPTTSSVPSTSTSTPTTTTATATTSTTTTSSPSSSCVVAPPSATPTPAGSAIAKRGMWIWELPATDGGSISRVIAQAKRSDIQTVYIKSGDGNAVWSQFTPTLVNELHAAGLHVCAWQFVYGNQPAAEAAVGAQAVADGAECLVIDAESQYQGKYVSAQTYITDLRARIGARFPLALAGFPYVDYHPTFPYSVFLGANGAQFNMPQMYWQDIGTTVDAVYAHTFEFNELYQRPIFPLGQLYDSPPTASVKKFRSVGLAYKATGVSWWDFQSAGTAQFSAIAAPAGPIKGYRADTTVASLTRGAAGDLVVLAQEHLWNTPERVSIDGGFGAKTQAAVRQFQRAKGLPVTGIITPQTWADLLKVPVANVKWTLRGKRTVATVPG
jgi:hypothetical protein